MDSILSYSLWPSLRPSPWSLYMVPVTQLLFHWEQSSGSYNVFYTGVWNSPETWMITGSPFRLNMDSSQGCGSGLALSTTGGILSSHSPASSRWTCEDKLQSPSPVYSPSLFLGIPHSCRPEWMLGTVFHPSTCTDYSLFFLFSKCHQLEYLYE